MELVVPEGFQALMVPRSHYGRGVVDGVGGSGGISEPDGPTIPLRVTGWWPWWCWVVMVVPEGFPDPKDPVIPFRVSGWCLWRCWVVLVVPDGFPDPKDPMIPFRVSCWWAMVLMGSFGGAKGIS